MLSFWCTPAALLTASITAGPTRPYAVASAQGYSAMGGCAQTCVAGMQADRFAGCMDYACVCRNYATAVLDLGVCIANCPAAGADAAAGSSILSAWCEAGNTTAVVQGGAASMSGSSSVSVVSVSAKATSTSTNTSGPGNAVANPTGSLQGAGLSTSAGGK